MADAAADGLKHLRQQLGNSRNYAVVEVLDDSSAAAPPGRWRCAIGFCFGALGPRRRKQWSLQVAYVHPGVPKTDGASILVSSLTNYLSGLRGQSHGCCISCTVSCCVSASLLAVLLAIPTLPQDFDDVLHKLQDAVATGPVLEAAARSEAG